MVSENSANYAPGPSYRPVSILLRVTEETAEPGPHLVKRLKNGNELMDVDGFVFVKPKGNRPALDAARAAPVAEQPAVTTPVANSEQQASTAAGMRSVALPTLHLSADDAAALLDACQEGCAGQLATSAQGEILGSTLAQLQDRFIALVSGALCAGRTDGNADVQEVETCGKEAEASVLQQELEARKRLLRGRLELFQQEEATWRMLASKGAALEAAQLAALQPQPLASGSCSPEAPVMEAGSAGGLRLAQEELHKKLTMQVEGLCALVRGVEALYEKADSVCHAIQTKFHHEKFKALPHVDSPARLIRDLVHTTGSQSSR